MSKSNYTLALEHYLDNGINYGANTIKNANEDDLRQLASDSFQKGAEWMRGYLESKVDPSNPDGTQFPNRWQNV